VSFPSSGKKWVGEIALFQNYNIMYMLKDVLVNAFDHCIGCNILCDVKNGWISDENDSQPLFCCLTMTL